jgi:hypothetical protein
MKTKLTLLHHPADEIEIVREQSIWCPLSYAYFVPDKETDLLQFARTVYAAEKEKMDWIRKYDNVLAGLNYWRNKAQEK